MTDEGTLRIRPFKPSGSRGLKALVSLRRARTARRGTGAGSRDLFDHVPVLAGAADFLHAPSLSSRPEQPCVTNGSVPGFLLTVLDRTL